MRIALFHDFLVRMGGAEHVLFTFARMFPEAEIYTLFADSEAVAKKYPNAPALHVHPGAQRMYSILKGIPLLGKHATKLLLPWYAQWVEDMHFEGYDLVIISSTAWALGAITPLETPTVCYIHSPARFLWDYFPQYKRELGVRHETDLRNIVLTTLLSPLRLWSRLAGDRPHLMICNARTVQKRVEKFYKRQDSVVLNPPVDVKELQCTGANPEGSFLLISTLSPYKNIDALLTWWKNRPEQLLIVGDGPDRERLKKLAPKNVTFKGYVSTKERNRLLMEARAVLYPSMEDFGIVPIEAMAAGKVTLALGHGGATETLEDGVTGILFESLSEEDLTDAWNRFLQLETTYAPEALRSQAEQYSAERFQEQFMHLLQEHDLNL